MPELSELYSKRAVDVASAGLVASSRTSREVSLCFVSVRVVPRLAVLWADGAENI